MLSISDSPLETDEYWIPSVMGMTLPLKRAMAEMKEELVRVLGS